MNETENNTNTMEDTKKKTILVKPASVGFKNAGKKSVKVPTKPFTIKVRSEFKTPKTTEPATFHASSALKGLNAVLFAAQSGVAIL